MKEYLERSSPGVCRLVLVPQNQKFVKKITIVIWPNKVKKLTSVARATKIET